MINNVEEKVSTFYNTIGWETEGEITEDAKRFEDLRKCAEEYVSKCRLRILRHVPDCGENMLDMASGPIQFREYLEYSKYFKKRYCIDLSSMALEIAKRKIGEYGVFICGSFFDIDLEEDFFDCTISLHTIYHIEKENQEAAVRKMIKVTKPGQPIIIVYSNPNAFIRYLALSLQFLGIGWIKRSFTKKGKNDKQESALYFFAHPIEWWNRFSDVAEIKILPWRSFNSKHQKAIIPNNKFGKILFNILFNLEDRYPHFFVKYFQYPMIILKKRGKNALQTSS